MLFVFQSGAHTCTVLRQVPGCEAGCWFCYSGDSAGAETIAGKIECLQGQRQASEFSPIEDDDIDSHRFMVWTDNNPLKYVLMKPK